MSRPSGAGAVAWIAALTLAATPASAQFYSLEGRFLCLEQPGATCYDATPTAQPPKPVSVERAPEAEDSPFELPARPLGGAPPRPATPAATAADPLREVATRVMARKPAPGDLALLRSRAARGDGHAFELLAWCAAAGIGGARDPMQAYRLYGEAAAAGIAGARANQAAIYERGLTPEQRQQALDAETARLAGAPASPPP